VMYEKTAIDLIVSIVLALAIMSMTGLDEDDANEQE